MLEIRFDLAKSLQAAADCNVHYPPQGGAVAQKKVMLITLLFGRQGELSQLNTQELIWTV